jgi:hypothetical protein
VNDSTAECGTRVETGRPSLDDDDDEAAAFPLASSIDSGDSPCPMTWSIAAARLGAGTVPVICRPARSSAV